MSLILYISGTSGQPKGAMLSERAIDETAISLSQLGAVDRHSRFLCDGPMFHVIGIVSAIRPALMWGRACLVCDGFVGADARPAHRPGARHYPFLRRAGDDPRAAPGAGVRCQHSVARHDLGQLVARQPPVPRTASGKVQKNVLRGMFADPPIA